MSVDILAAEGEGVLTFTSLQQRAARVPRWDLVHSMVVLHMGWPECDRSFSLSDAGGGEVIVVSEHFATPAGPIPFAAAYQYVVNFAQERYLRQTGARVDLMPYIDKCDDVLEKYPTETGNRGTRWMVMQRQSQGPTPVGQTIKPTRVKLHIKGDV